MKFHMHFELMQLSKDSVGAVGIFCTGFYFFGCHADEFEGNGAALTPPWDFPGAFDPVFSAVA